MTKYNLKECPFCGSDKLDFSLKTSEAGYHACVYCKSCHTYGPRVLVKSDTRYWDRYRYEHDEAIKQEASEKWNERNITNKADGEI